MNLKNKKGITMVSIMVYVLLFFAFTTIATVISSRINKNLFNDRGNAINITAINKLEYNLLKSADESYNVDMEISGNKRTLTFSNSDVYVFDKDKNVIYKNGGKLVKFVKDMTLRIQEDIINIDIVLNKYTNEVARNIKIKCASNINTKSYVQDGLVVQYDGIKNTNYGHDNTSTYWQDISGNNVKAELNDSLIEKNAWRDDGIVIEKANTNDYSMTTPAYEDYVFPQVTFEITTVIFEQLGTDGNSYWFPLYIRENNNNLAHILMAFGTRFNYTLMYGYDHHTGFYAKKGVYKDKMYTFTFVQSDLTTRKLYINGELMSSSSGLNLSDIALQRLYMHSDPQSSYKWHSLRIYNKALTDEEILANYNVDTLRFGK